MEELLLGVGLDAVWLYARVSKPHMVKVDGLVDAMLRRGEGDRGWMDKDRDAGTFMVDVLQRGLALSL